MSVQELLEQVKALSPEEKEEFWARASAYEEEDTITPEEAALVDEAMKDYDPATATGIPLEHIREHIAERLKKRA